MKKRIDWKRFFYRIGRIILIPVVLLELLFAILLIREAWLYFFYPIKLPLSAQITDFQDMTLLYNNVVKECEDMSDVTKYSYPTFDANIFNPESYESLAIDQFSTSDNATPINFVILATKGHITSTTYVEGKEPVVADWDLVDRGGTIQATAFRATSTLPHNLIMNQQLCGDKITILRSGSDLNFSFGASTNDYRAARLTLNLDKGDEILLTLYGPVKLPNSDTVAEKLEIKFLANGNLLNGKPSIFMIGAEGYDLSGQFPWMSAFYDKDKKEYVWDYRNSVTAFADGGSITAPIGKVQFGAYKNVELYESLAMFTDEELEVPLSPESYINFDYQSFNLTGNPAKGTIEISGNASKALYRKQEYGFSRWSKLPGYIQTGIFGLILGAIPAWWGFFRNRASKKTVESSDLGFQPSEGSFICMMDSGYMIAGILVKEPGFWSSYYVVRDAHRKRTSEKNWESEIIPLINIKASRVEHYYFKGK